MTGREGEREKEREDSSSQRSVRPSVDCMLIGGAHPCHIGISFLSVDPTSGNDIFESLVYCP